LLDAALDMFAAKGVEATTIEEVTEKADVGKGTFYRHFANKDAVVEALTGEILDRLIDKIRAQKEKPKSVDEVLEWLVDAHVSFFGDRVGEFMFLFQGRSMLRLQKASDIEKPYAKYVAEIQNQLALHLAPDEVEPAKARKLAGALIGSRPALVMACSWSAASTAKLITASAALAARPRRRSRPISSASAPVSR